VNSRDFARLHWLRHELGYSARRIVVGTRFTGADLRACGLGKATLRAKGPGRPHREELKDALERWGADGAGQEYDVETAQIHYWAIALGIYPEPIE